MREKKSDKNQSELLAAAEAILFTMGKSVELSKMAEALGLSEAQTKALIEKLKEKYEDECCGLQIVELEKSYQMCTKSSMYEYLIRIASQPKKNVLSDALLETLSIIAYKQPVTRTEVENIRGVKCEHAVNKLIEYNLDGTGKTGRTWKTAALWNDRRILKKIWSFFYYRTTGTGQG